MKERILVVNDEEVPRERISSLLAAEGYQCRAAKDGVEAEAMLNTEKFDMVICNMLMPRLCGTELLVRTRKKFSNLPFVLESGCSDSVFANIRENAADLGAFGCLQSPVDRDHLVSLVSRALGLSE